MKTTSILTLVAAVMLSGCAAFFTNAAFKELDVNGNGQLTFAEFEPLINDPEATHDPATPEAVAGFFRQADSDADGFVSPAEFDAFAQSRQ